MAAERSGEVAHTCGSGTMANAAHGHVAVPGEPVSMPPSSPSYPQAKPSRGSDEDANMYLQDRR